MAVIFHHIRFKNILSVGDNWVDVQLDANPMTLIIGKNGKGKSTILDAICFGLYGVAFREINKPQLVNSFNKKELVVEITFSVNQVKYLVRRGIKPNIFEYYRNGELIPEDSKTADYQKQFEQTILGINQKTFRQVNIIGAATFEPFMRLKPAERRLILENLLDCRIFGVMQDLAKIEAKTLRSQLQEFEEQSLVLKTKIDGQQKLIERQKADKQRLIEQYQQDIQINQTKLTSSNDKLVELENDLATAKIKLAQIAANPTKVITAQKQLNEDLAVSSYRISQLDRQVISDQESCDLCRQKIDHTHRSQINNRINNEKVEITNKINTLTERKKVVDKLIADYDKQNDRCNDLNLQIIHVQAMPAVYTNNIKSLAEKIEQLSNQPQSQIDTKELDDLNGQLLTTNDKINDVDKGLKVLKSVVEQCGDSGIKANLISKYIPIVNDTLNQYLERLDLFAQFELDEQFNETVKSHYRDTFSYHSFSEGQKLRIDLAVLLTWRKIAERRDSVATNLLIMDEVLDRSLDVEGANNLMGILTEIFKEQNLFVISHNPNVIEMFDNVIEVTQNGNFTEYNYLGS